MEQSAIFIGSSEEDDTEEEEEPQQQQDNEADDSQETESEASGQDTTTDDDEADNTPLEQSMSSGELQDTLMIAAFRVVCDACPAPPSACSQHHRCQGRGHISGRHVHQRNEHQALPWLP